MTTIAWITGHAITSGVTILAEANDWPDYLPFFSSSNDPVRGIVPISGLA